MNRTLIKEQAKVSLKGKWPKILFTLGIYLLIITLPSYILTSNMTLENATYLTIIRTILMIGEGILAVGLTSFFLKMGRSEETDYSELFIGFKDIKFGLKYLGLSLMTGILVALWSLLFVIPGIVASYKYVMAPYILLDNPDIGIFEALNRSKELMKGWKFDYFVFGLSFFGWYILSSFTCGIAMAYVLPYVLTATAIYYDELVGKIADNPAAKGEEMDVEIITNVDGE